MFSTTRIALPLTAIKESCSCCSTPSDLTGADTNGRLRVDADAILAPGDHTETHP